MCVWGGSLALFRGSLMAIACWRVWSGLSWVDSHSWVVDPSAPSRQSVDTVQESHVLSKLHMLICPSLCLYLVYFMLFHCQALFVDHLSVEMWVWFSNPVFIVLTTVFATATLTFWILDLCLPTAWLSKLASLAVVVAVLTQFVCLVCCYS